ncbi:helix-turn-helix transcriptional regulator [Lysobacter sp. K5869]|uniref:helix-turn-helix domain-containing protein n=1 Tax=Lysobacter sp. K5869 TaxID=2820808 RepID=UPI001C063783|nr:helix-turn-helix transcriptional regulator [Lysobacter sp. K5869]QWP75412.1 helix-turn-helix transcriptional regulator [Lysobacter sp. K5869]
MIYDRIRMARRSAGLSQTELGLTVGVGRSAVAQWESRNGSFPSSENLGKIAVTCAVSHEWLATGRGRMAVDAADGAAPAAPPSDSFAAKNSLESRLLNLFRELSGPGKLQLLKLLEVISSQPRKPSREKEPDHATQIE